ncbi:hypothetical protein [Rhizobium alvei]|uniref:Uncharacterized protein n=1 Tax=Rhizobium alvei TaxID=1132659 RepID=A0ABT8YJ73_9HYPH|nr:hypothetical protein [Rhizobium alvei]MDO6963752.1 hypothetical protein [Rhizobium alvei]
MRSHFLGITIAAATLLAPFAALAGETLSVPAGRSSVVGGFNVYNPNTCGTAGKPQMKVHSAPAHGSVSFKWVLTKFSDEFTVCKGKPAHSMLIIYTPHKGFHGQDSFTWGARFESHEVGSQTGYKTAEITVNVK